MPTYLIYLHGGGANENLREYLWSTHRGARKFFLSMFNALLTALVDSTCEYANDCEWRAQKALELGNNMHPRGYHP